MLQISIVVPDPTVWSSWKPTVGPQEQISIEDQILSQKHKRKKGYMSPILLEGLHLDHTKALKHDCHMLKFINSY